MIPPEVEKTKGTITIVFGRFNPPTIGHKKLLDTAAEFSENNDYLIVPSRTQDKKKNPLSADIKISFMKRMFNIHAEKILNEPEIKTIFDVLVKSHMDGYSNVRIVVGSDRVEEFEKITGNYNGKLYQFKKIELLSAGDRDPDGEGLEGVSASNQRQLVMDNNFEQFQKGIPGEISEELAKELFDNLQNSMRI